MLQSHADVQPENRILYSRAFRKALENSLIQSKSNSDMD